MHVIIVIWFIEVGRELTVMFAIVGIVNASVELLRSIQDNRSNNWLSAMECGARLTPSFYICLFCTSTNGEWVCRLMWLMILKSTNTRAPFTKSEIIQIPCVRSVRKHNSTQTWSNAWAVYNVTCTVNMRRNNF